MNASIRFACLDDIKDITNIYNQGIEDRMATLETRLRTPRDMENWLIERNERYRVIVVEQDGKTLGWASLNQFNPRECYSGVADFSIYIERQFRGKGLGKMLLLQLMETAREQGFHKLVLSTFIFNEQGLRLYKSLGFREVGTYVRQARLDDKWIDITIMEKLLLQD
jgi:L-amino acid N-acyltransferase YncA